MSTPSFNNIGQLSAFLDGQLTQSQKTRLEARLRADPALAGALEDLRQVRTMLRRVPHRRARRNFTLTPKMAGIRPPVPRLVPALSWASAVAMMLFVCTLGFNLLGSLTLGASAPKAVSLYAAGGGPAPATAAPATLAPAAAPLAVPAPATAAPAIAALATAAPAPATAAPVLAPAPLATQAPQTGTEMSTATLEVSRLAAPEATAQNVTSLMPPPVASAPQPKREIPWLYIWLGLAVLLVGAALLIRWLNERAFARRIRH